MTIPKLESRILEKTKLVASGSITSLHERFYL